MFEPGGPTFWEQAQQALSSTRRGYDLLAPKFDRTPYRTPDRILDGLTEIVGDCGSALDLCCGTGAGMRMLRPLASKKVVGIDFSEGMLAQAKANLKNSAGNAALEFLLGDVLDMEFEGQFDVATCFGALGHITAEMEATFLSRVSSALKPGGRFIFVTSFSPKIWSPVFWLCHGFNAAMHVRNFFIKPPFIMFYLTFLLPEIAEKLEEAGFEVETVASEKLGSYRVVVATKR